LGTLNIGKREGDEEKMLGIEWQLFLAVWIGAEVEEG